jgi:CHASE2 domain-containing sensor protein
MASFLETSKRVTDHYTTWLLLLAAVLGGLFEWRVRSENKSFIRLSAWGTVAVGLLVAGVLWWRRQSPKASVP